VGYRGKRSLDLLILAATALPVVAVGAIVALAVRLTSQGPVLFRQERIGLNGEPFQALKFRSMLDGDNPLIPAENRITKVGRILRRFSLDELPQLINVARGEMSVVGPRPTLNEQVDRYNDVQRRRLEVRPGITGLAQINGRNSIPWDERIRYDVDYVERCSLRLDLSILAGTLGAVTSAEGVEGHPDDDPIVTGADRVRPTDAGGHPGK
jgi:lipopolysaccharide/colanic/teichoic acid biosynthesis glycosyltransferase